MKYTNIARYVAASVWSIQADKLHDLLEVLAHRAAGHVFSAEEIQARIGEPQPAAAAKRGAVAVVPIRGVIAHRMGSMDDTSGGTSTERVASMFRQVLADEQIGTIVFDVDSPGGTVQGCQELAAEIFAARGQKRMIAVANSTMASAAYWIGCQADEVVAIPSAISVGSIGVFTVHEDLSKALEQEGVNVSLISAGKYKVEGNPFEPLSDEAKAVLQAKVDATYSQFVKDVARARGVSPSDVRNGFGEGRALGAAGAKAAGLVDRIATMDDTIGRLVGRKSAGGMRAETPVAPDDLRARLQTEDEPLDETLARLLEAPRFGKDDDVDRARRLRLL
jgi:signal peptide peptidase SppA